jgi:enoyl-CoA hydratase/carnithine racemase
VVAGELLEDLGGDGVLVLTFNRPDRNNAWTHDLEDRYFAALERAAADPAVRVIVVTGAGRSFCPGMDMEVLAELSTAGPIVRPRAPMTFALQIPKPVIAAVNGAAAGVGLVHVCAADLRFAAASAKFTTSFARRGLPAEHGVASLLTRLVGTGAATDLLLSARVVLAEEALAMGLVDRVVPSQSLLDETLAYARDLALNCSPSAMATIKGQIVDDWLADHDAARRRSLDHAARMREHPDFAEGVASYRERRPPAFAGLAQPVGAVRETPP